MAMSSVTATWRLSLHNGILCVKSNMFSQNWENKQSSPLCVEGRAGPAMRGSPGKIFTLRWKLHIRCIIQGVARSGHIHSPVCPGQTETHEARPCPGHHQHLTSLCKLFIIKPSHLAEDGRLPRPSHSHAAVTSNCYTKFTEAKSTWINFLRHFFAMRRSDKQIRWLFYIIGNIPIVSYSKWFWKKRFETRPNEWTEHSWRDFLVLSLQTRPWLGWSGLWVSASARCLLRT